MINRECVKNIDLLGKNLHTVNYKYFLKLYNTNKSSNENENKKNKL
jgi:hypothetical protein